MGGAGGGRDDGSVTFACGRGLERSSGAGHWLDHDCLRCAGVARRMTSCPFPRVLEVIKLHAFDLIKIVQTYVRHMPGMPL